MRIRTYGARINMSNMVAWVLRLRRICTDRSVCQELEYRVTTGGQKPMDAITSATSLAAESLGIGDRVGTIANGYEADLIAVDGNPLHDITALSRISFVMKGGKVVKGVSR